MQRCKSGSIVEQRSPLRVCGQLGQAQTGGADRGQDHSLKGISKIRYLAVAGVDLSRHHDPQHRSRREPRGCI
jgi:hypothetical protein